MNEAFISMGSNIGDRFHHLKEAIQTLHLHDKVSVLLVSSVYETEPVGYTDQEDFLNVVVFIETSLNPYELLAACQEIESELGRVRNIRWGPRTVDLDILLYNHDAIETEDLIVPHPRMHERAFVLVPLIEVSPMIAHPRTGKLFADEVVVKDDGVVLWKKIDGIQAFIQ